MENPFQYMNEEATRALEKNPIYHEYLDYFKKQSAFVDNVIYPAAFGTSGCLIGIAAAKDMAPGDIIMKIPCSLRIDIATIQASDVGSIIKSLTDDEDYGFALYFCYHRVLGDKSHLYHVLRSATSADLPLEWSE
jgi:hypothetical protein